MSKKQRIILYRIIVTLLLFISIFIIRKLDNVTLFDNKYLLLVVCLVPYLIIGYDVIFKAFRNIVNGQVFDENFLMVIATFGAFVVSEYVEAVAVMLFYQVGELFQSYAVGKSRESIKELMEICPEYANLERDGEIEKVDPDDVEVGSIIVIKPGERIPLDGIVIEGESMVDTAAITGEYVPRSVKVSDEVISGCINGSGSLRVRTTKGFEDSTVSKILELVENASSKKASVENFITKFAKYYTPMVTIGALLCAIVPPLFWGGNFSEWIETACTFLVISCPCALVISVPLGFFGGIGAASKNGILVKGSNYLEAISKVTTIAMDKTGTLTKGEFKVKDVYVSNNQIDKYKLIEIAAHGEMYSNHPIAKSIIAEYKEKLDTSRVENAIDLSGMGIEVLVDNKKVYLGNKKLMNKLGIDYEVCDKAGTIVYVAYEDEFLGSILISDSIKESTPNAIRMMRKKGIKNIVMLTGDNKESADSVGKELTLDIVYSELLPEDKVKKLEELLDGNQNGGKLAFVGDGINDAPVLMRADIGIAMGAMGSDAAIEAADIVIMDDDINKIPQIIDIANRTLSIVRQNIVFALGVKFAIMILAMFHIVGMWGGVFADVGVAVIAIFNSMRMIYLRNC